MHISVYRNRYDNAPSIGEGSWELVASSLRNLRECSCTLATCQHAECPEKNGLSWSAAWWPPGATRGLANVIGIGALIFDLDHIPTDDALRAAMSRFAPLRAVAHASHSDRPGDRCVRVVLALTREVTGPEWPRFWRAAAAMIGADADRVCKDASRLYYLPSRPRDAMHPATDGTGYYYASWNGALLDVDEVMRRAPPEAAPSVGPSALATFTGAPSIEKIGEAVAALAAVWPRERGRNGGKGGRHQAGLALCGALAHAGWPAQLVGEFVAAVAGTAEPGNAEEHKWANTARASCSKVAAGESVSGWPTVLALLEQYRPEGAPAGEAIVGAARGALGIGPPPVPPGFADALREAASTPAALADAAPGSWEDQLAQALHDVQSKLGEEGEQRDLSPLFSRTVATMQGVASAATPWLVKGLVKARGTLVVSGEPKTGKSWVLSEIAMAVATATPAFASFVCGDEHPKRVAYFYAEDMADDVKAHTRALAASRGLDPMTISNLHVEPRGQFLDLLDDIHLARIIASVRAIGGVDLLCIEPLRDVHSAEEDKADAMRDVMRRLRALGEILRCTVAVAHHSSKASADGAKRRGGQKMRGSSVVHGSLDSGFYLVGLSGDGQTEIVNEVEVETKGAKSGGFFTLSLKIEDDERDQSRMVKWDVVRGAKAEHAAAAVDNRVPDVLRALAGTTEAMTHRAIQLKIKGKQDVVSAAIRIAVAEGLAEEVRSVGRVVGVKITARGLEVIRGAAALPASEVGPGPHPAARALLDAMGAGTPS